MQKNNGLYYGRLPSYRRVFICLALGGIAAVVVSVVILSWVPPVSRDALTHHLAVPKLWLEQGKIYPIPSILFSYYPMNLDLLYAIPLYMGNDIAPKYIHFAFAVLTAALIYLYLKQRLGIIYGLLGALFFLSIPIVVKLSISAYVDLGLLFFTMAALYYMFKWMETDFHIKYIIISGGFCGLALGTKYNGLIVFFLLTCFVPFLHLRQTGRQPVPADRVSRKNVHRQFEAMKHAVLFATMALALFSPWMVKNVIWTGNPIYPLYNGILSGTSHQPAGPAGPEVPQEDGPKVKANKKNSDWSLKHFAVRKYVYNETWLQTLLIPLRIFLEGKDDDPKYFDGKLNPFLLMLPLLALFTRKGRAEKFQYELDVLMSFSFIYLLFVYVQNDMRIRWVAPVIPPLVIVSMAGLSGMYQLVRQHLFRGNNMGAGGIVVIAAASMLGLNTQYIVEQFARVKPFAYISGEVSRDQYIQIHRPEYHAMRYANQHLGEDDTVLAVYLAGRRYYSDVKMDFNDMIFLKVFKRKSSAPSVNRYLNKKGYTHVLLRYDLFNNWANHHYSDEEKKVVDIFFREEATLLTEKGGYGLFRLNI